MDVTILGSGTAVPEADRFPSGVLVTAADSVLLIDLGPGVLRRLAQAGYGPEHVTHVLFTHYHTDHTADLAALLFALRNPRYAGRAPLRLMGNTGLQQLLGHLTAAWPWLEPKGYPLEVEEIGPGRHQVGDFETNAVPIRHTAASLAYRLEATDGTSFAISGDADDCEGLTEVAQRADLFVCEAAFPDGQHVEGHITPSIAGRHAQAAKVKTLCLTHFYPECEGHDLAAQARTTFDGEVVLARDLMRFRLASGQCARITNVSN